MFNSFSRKKLVYILLRDNVLIKSQMSNKKTCKDFRPVSLINSEKHFLSTDSKICLTFKGTTLTACNNKGRAQG